MTAKDRRRSRRKAAKARQATAKAWPCERCSTRLFDSALESSAIFTNADGVAEKLVCADCLTIDEITDMIILETTREVAVSTDGRIWNRPKVSLFMERD